MPTFDFRCTACARTFEAKIPFGSKEYPPCPACSARAEKLMTKPLGIVFKGSGFYKTDSGSVQMDAKAADAPEKGAQKDNIAPKPDGGSAPSSAA